MGQLIAIVSQKGGVGKTTTAVNLGACLSAIRRKVLLVGMDPQCGLAKCFGMDASYTDQGLLDVVRDGASPASVIYRSHQRLPRLDLIPANIRSSAEEAQFTEILEKQPATLLQILNSPPSLLRFRIYRLSSQIGQSHNHCTGLRRFLSGSHTMRVCVNGYHRAVAPDSARRKEKSKHQAGYFRVFVDHGGQASRIYRAGGSGDQAVPQGQGVPYHHSSRSPLGRGSTTPGTDHCFCYGISRSKSVYSVGEGDPGWPHHPAE